MASSILMPAILEFNYPSFDMEKENVTFIGKISINNNLAQVDHIQVKITQQDDGKNGLNTDFFPKNIYFIKNQSTDIFYIKLNLQYNGKSIFKNSYDNLIPTFYKMQVRLGYKDENYPEKMYNEEWGQTPPDGWLENNGDLFSEWSNTSIIKSTFSPDVNVLGLSNVSMNNIDNPYQLFNANYITKDKEENIQSYKFELLDTKGFLIEEQELNYIKDYITPSITYQIKSYIKTEKNYVLKLTTESTYGLIQTVVYDLYFTGAQEVFPLEVIGKSNIENATNVITIKYNNIFSNIDKILVKRLSMSNYYNSYDNLFEINNISNFTKDIIFNDYIINSDELYIYYLQIVYKDGTYSSLSKPIKIICSYDYTYIMGENQEQIIVYSPQISNVTLTKRDVLTETLGEKYPYFQKIGYIDYKTFNITGTISYLSIGNEENKIKDIAINDIYGKNASEEVQNMIKEFYGDKIGENYTTSIDYFMEKEYRNKISSFLNNGEIKIIKSPTERLMFTRFTNVNITPKEELGRAIYDFSLTATEIFGEKNIDYSKYKFGEAYEL